MKVEETYYDNFPLWMPILAVVPSLAIYGVGAYIFAGFGLIFAVLYLLYCLWVELRVMRKSCVLYVFRCAVYYTSHEHHEPELLKWWSWKDANCAVRYPAKRSPSR
jgi:hypothetical protein